MCFVVMVKSKNRQNYCGINFAKNEKFRKHQRSDPDLKHLYKVKQTLTTFVIIIFIVHCMVGAVVWQVENWSVRFYGRNMALQ